MKVALSAADRSAIQDKRVLEVSGAVVRDVLSHVETMGDAAGTNAPSRQCHSAATSKTCWSPCTKTVLVRFYKSLKRYVEIGKTAAEFNQGHFRNGNLVSRTLTRCTKSTSIMIQEAMQRPIMSQKSLFSRLRYSSKRAESSITALPLRSNQPGAEKKRPKHRILIVEDDELVAIFYSIKTRTLRLSNRRPNFTRRRGD